jgi:hypothetical protein
MYDDASGLRDNAHSGAQVMTIKIKLLLAALIILATPMLAHAQNFFYAQTAQGSNTGANCANAFAYNDVTNGMALKAAAGVTLHICGTWNGAANQQWVTFTTSGTGPSGTNSTCTNPITLVWEAGALVQAPYHNTTSAGFVFNNQSCWVIDGQISAGVNSSCNITTYNSGACPTQLQNTLQGSPSATLSGVSVSGGTATATCTVACQPYINPANSNDVPAVIISGTSVSACNVQVRPLTNISTTVFTYATPAGCTTATGGTVFAVCPAGACTDQQINGLPVSASNVNHFEIKNVHWGPSFVVGLFTSTSNASFLLQINGSFTNVHDSTMHDAGNIIDETHNRNTTSNSFSNLDLFHACWLMGYAPLIATDFEWFNNHMHDIGNYSNGSVSTCHGNGIHTFSLGNGVSGNTQGVQAIYAHDNLADGDWGVATSGIPYFFEGRSPCGGTPAGGPSDTFANGSGASTGTFYEWNDVVAAFVTSGHPPNGFPAISCGNGHIVVNNYFMGAGPSGNGTNWDNNPSIDPTQTGVTYVNNVNQFTDVLFNQVGSSQAAPTQIDFNIYGANSGGNPAWNVSPVSTNSFTTWQGAGFDVHGFHFTTLVPNINSCTTYECGAGQPTSGFAGLSAGTNLTSLCTGNPNLVGICLTSTAGGTATASARPTSGNWNIGPLVTGTTVSAPTFSPPAGTYTSTQNVALATTTTGAAICYTLNGSTPTAVTAGTCDSNGGVEFTYTTPISVSVTTTITALGTLSGDTNSSVTSALYTINLPSNTNGIAFPIGIPQ